MVYGFGFEVWGLGRVWGLGLSFFCFLIFVVSWLIVYGFGFEVWGLGYRVWGRSKPHTR